MPHIRSNVCLDISEGAHLRCYTLGSNEACVQIGQVDHELSFDYPTFRDLVAQATEVLGAMEAKAEEEEAEWEADQARQAAADQAGRPGQSA